MIQTIIEGAFPDTPSRLLYCGIELQIPKNASLLQINEHQKYLLYGRGFSNFNVTNDPHFYETADHYRHPQGGWPLKKFDPKINWTFDAQRSLTTRDGRIYIDLTYFHKDWRWYLEKKFHKFWKTAEKYSPAKNQKKISTRNHSAQHQLSPTRTQYFQELSTPLPQLSQLL